MNYETYFIHSKPGMVFEIFSRHGGIEFIMGYCRALALHDRNIYFVEGFCRHTDPSMAAVWSGPSIWEPRPFVGAQVDVVPEQPWMRMIEPLNQDNRRLP